MVQNPKDTTVCPSVSTYVLLPKKYGKIIRKSTRLDKQQATQKRHNTLTGLAKIPSPKWIIPKYGLNKQATALTEMGLNNGTSLGHNCR